MSSEISQDQLQRIYRAVEAVLPDTHYPIILIAPFMNRGETGSVQSVVQPGVHPQEISLVISAALQALIRAIPRQ